MGNVICDTLYLAVQIHWKHFAPSLLFSFYWSRAVGARLPILCVFDRILYLESLVIDRNVLLPRS